MLRDSISTAIFLALLAIGGMVALVVVAASLDRAAPWVTFGVVLLGIAGAWLLCAQVYAARGDEHFLRAQERERSEERSRAMALERDRIAGVLSAVPEAVIAADSAGRVTVANGAARALFEELNTPGRSIEDVFTQHEILSLHARATGGQGGQEKFRHSHHGSLRTFEVVACPLADGAASGSERPRFGSVIVLRDVTELALAVQLKTDFVANASHELRTPLSSIRLAAETIAEAAREDPELVVRLSAVVLQNAARLEDLVRDLLDLSRVESPDVPPARERVVLSEMLASIEQMFEEIRTVRRLGIESAIDPDANEFVSDPRLIELVLKNLIDNATKYAFEGTTVRVSASRVGGGLPGQSMVRVRVSDKGIGIPITQQGRIFERFYQVDMARSGPSARRGTGLGLAIVKHALKRLGGTIRVESVWQQGTTMIVEVPLGAVPAVAAMRERSDGDSE